MRHKKRTVEHVVRYLEASGAANVGDRAWCTVKYRVQQEDKTMKHANLAIAVMVIASLFAPTVYAKKKPPAPPPAGTSSQAGGLPASNARIAELEGAVVALRAELDALSIRVATIPSVFVDEGSVNNLRGATVTVASKTVPAGTYLIMAAVQMVNGQSLGDAKARCVMKANGNSLAETSDLLFPILTTAAGPPSNAFGSTIFAPLQSSYSSASPITILVECSEGNGGAGGLDAFVNIAALKVATVH